MLLNYQIGSYSPSPSSASLNPSVRLDQIEIESQSSLKTYDYVPITPESLDRTKGLDKGAGGAKTSGSAFGDMNPADTARYNQYWDDVAKGLDTNTRVKLNQWEYRPNADLYNDSSVKR